MLTGHADYEVDLEATMLGVTDFLDQGPPRRSLLERSIRYAVRHHHVLNELRESQDRYALAVMGANDGIWDWDLISGEVYFGPRWKEILGHAEEEIGARPRSGSIASIRIDLDRLRAAVDAHLEGETPHFESEHRIGTPTAAYRWVLSRALAVREPRAIATRIAGSMSDITDRKAPRSGCSTTRSTTPSPGFPTGRCSSTTSSSRCSRAKRDRGLPCAVLFLDLNRFKLVNDGFSHAVGDQLLQSLSRGGCGRAIRPGDTVARFGGDEFTILLHDVESADAAIEVAERMRRRSREPFRPRAGTCGSPAASASR